MQFRHTLWRHDKRRRSIRWSASPSWPLAPAPHNAHDKSVFSNSSSLCCLSSSAKLLPQHVNALTSPFSAWKTDRSTETLSWIRSALAMVRRADFLWHSLRRKRIYATRQRGPCFSTFGTVSPATRTRIFWLSSKHHERVGQTRHPFCRSVLSHGCRQRLAAAPVAPPTSRRPSDWPHAAAAHSITFNDSVAIHSTRPSSTQVSALLEGEISWEWKQTKP